MNAKRKRGQPRGNPREEAHDYLLIDTDMAKVLYTILKLQQQFLEEVKDEILESDQPNPTELDFPRASRDRILHFSGVKGDRVLQTIISQLRAARYILPGSLRRQQGKLPKKKQGHEIFEPRVDLVASCADTAIVLLSLLQHARMNVAIGPVRHRDDLTKDLERDGKVNRRDFVHKLLQEKHLAYFSEEDLLGNGRHKGKLDELADSGEYLERVSDTHIRPRMRIALEYCYLMLLKQQLKLDEVQDAVWARGLWKSREMQKERPVQV